MTGETASSRTTMRVRRRNSSQSGSLREDVYAWLRRLVGTSYDRDVAHLVSPDHDTWRVRIRLVRELALGFARYRAFELASAIAGAHVYTCFALPATAGITAPEYA